MWRTRLSKALAFIRNDECVYAVFRGKSLRTARVEILFAHRADAEDYVARLPKHERGSRIIDLFSVQ